MKSFSTNFLFSLHLVLIVLPACFLFALLGIAISFAQMISEHKKSPRECNSGAKIK